MIGYEQAARYAQLVAKLTGDEEIVPPGLTLEADRPEYSALKREFLFGRTVNSTAVAAQFSHALLLNPAGGPLVVVKLCHGLGIDYTVSVDQGIVGAGAASGVTRDTRVRQGIGGGVKFSVATVATGAQVALVNAAVRLAHRPTGVAYDQPVILRPGSQLVLQGAVVNTALDFDFSWTERIFRPEEVAEL